ncbi:hypothetical protein J7M28_08145 [bacterium]|nr:hypothetical protein [bacterium]
MRQYLIAGIVVCMLAAIASSASAGYFATQGYVTPLYGVAGETEFEYHVCWQLEGEEEPPVMYVGIHDGDWFYSFHTSMQVIDIYSGVVYYWLTTKLPYSDEWFYRFEQWSSNQYTNPQEGPYLTPGTP